MPSNCPACWQLRDSFGHVTWPNGRGADVCVECLDSMWHRGDDAKREIIAPAPESPTTQVIRELVDMGLVTLNPTEEGT